MDRATKRYPGPSSSEARSSSIRVRSGLRVALLKPGKHLCPMAVPRGSLRLSVEVMSRNLDLAMVQESTGRSVAVFPGGAAALTEETQLPSARRLRHRW